MQFTRNPDVRVPSAQVYGHQPHARVDQSARQEDPLAPRRCPAAVGRLGIERWQEAVTLADRSGLFVQVDASRAADEVRMAHAFC